MNKDNIVQFPKALDRLAAGIKAELEKAKVGREAWIEAMVSVALQIAEARREFKDDQAFGQWWDNQDFGLHRNDRAALIRMAAEPDKMREVFASTKRHSLQHIFAENIGRFPQVRKPHTPRRAATPPQAKVTPRRLDPDRSRPLETKAREAVRAAKDAGLPVNVRDIGERIGVSHVIVEQAAAMERAVEEDRRNPIVDPESLSLTAQKKLAAIQHRLEENAKRTLAAWRLQLDEEVRVRVMADTAKRLEMLEKMEKEQIEARDRYNNLINNFKPLYTVEEWEVLRRVTHPDNSASEATRARAFGLINDKKLQLTGKK